MKFLNEMDRLRNEIYDVTGRDMIKVFSYPSSLYHSSFKTDIETCDDKYIITCEAPGVKKEDIKVEIINNTLKISITKNNKTEETDVEHKYLLKEISFHKETMSRVFEMDVNNYC